MVWHFDHEKRARRWWTVARECGLTDLKLHRWLWFAHSVEARAGALQVVLDADKSLSYEDGSFVIVTGVASALDSLTRATDGLPPVGGPPLLRAALFDAATRRVVTALLESRLEQQGLTPPEKLNFRQVKIRRGVLRVTVRAPITTRDLFLILDAARGLIAPAAVEQAVADGLRSERDPAFRLNALRALVVHAPDHPATAEAVTASLADDAPEVRLEAALAAREAGRATLEALALAKDAPDFVSARALEVLGATLPSDALCGALRAALASARPLAALACVDALAPRGREAVSSLVDAVASGDARVARAAADAVGRFGAGAEVVIALREAEARHPRDAGVRAAVRASVSAVQGRLQGAGAGQLSEASPDAGTLALADDARGRLATPAPADAPDIGRERGR
jgi:hypothetical protein